MSIELEDGIPGMQAGRLKYRGVFDYDKLYKLIYSWMVANDFMFFEDKFKYKPPDEMEMTYRGEKRITDYIKYHVKVEIQMRDYKEVEVVKDGNKSKMASARLLMDFTGTVETDWQGFWKDTEFKVRLRMFFDRFILRHRLDFEHRFYLFYRVVELHNKVKHLLGMDTKGNAYPPDFD